MFKLFIVIVSLVLLILGIVLGVLNPAPVTLDVFLIKMELPLGLVLAVTLVLGALLGVLGSSFQIARLKWQIRKQAGIDKKRLNEIVVLKTRLSRNDETLRNNDNSLVKLEKQVDVNASK